MIKCKQTHTVITLSSHITRQKWTQLRQLRRVVTNRFPFPSVSCIFMRKKTGSPIYLSQPGCGQRTVLMILTEQLPVSRRREPATQSDTTAMTS